VSKKRQFERGKSSARTRITTSSARYTVNRHLCVEGEHFGKFLKSDNNVYLFIYVFILI